MSYPTAGTVSIYDADRKIVFDPETINCNYKSDAGMDWMADYPIFVGYFAVNTGTVIQPI